MKLVVDCRYVRVGISRFTAHIVEELAKRHPLTMLISDHRQLDNLPALPWELVSGPTSLREPFVARQVRRLKPDVVFSPMQTMGSWGRTYGLVLTLHDLIYYENRTPPRDLIAWEERLCRKAELAFGLRLPNGAAVVERARASLALSDQDVAPTAVGVRFRNRRPRGGDRLA